MDEPSQKYQQHIEQAIQNVLRKVKNPDFRKKQAQLAQDADALVEEIDAVLEGPESKEAPEEPTPELQLDLSLEDEPEKESQDEGEPPELMSAEDLYQPLILNNEKEEQEVQEEPSVPEDPFPLVAKDYHPPFNIFEELVETELNILLQRYTDICRCGQCRGDMVALALQQLPAYYVTGTRGTLTAKSVIYARYMQPTMDAVSKAVHKVYKRPRNSCQKIKKVIWVEQPEMESMESLPEELFLQNIEENEPELKFSEEVAEILKWIEDDGDTSEEPPEEPLPDLQLIDDWD